MTARVQIEADGGSRGNPGPAGFGAVLRDASTGAVLAEAAEPIGVASNNVAEYRGLIAGLELAAEFAPGAAIEVRMDSRLVVEQMNGTWKVKHPAMVPLAARARELTPAGTVFVWVPRAENGYADRLANEAMDGRRSGVTALAEPDASLVAEVESVAATVPSRGWDATIAPPTTVILLRHGVTVHTAAKRFSGGLGGDNPPLSDEGRAQIRASATWVQQLAMTVDAIVASPVRRTAESAAIAGDVLGLPVTFEPGFAEMEFGRWDGLSFAEVSERYPDELSSWLGSLDVAPGGGESFREVEERVLAGLTRLVEAHQGQTVLVVSHVTPIKTLVAAALGAPLSAVYQMELAPASVSVISYYEDGDDGTTRGSMRLFNGLPPERSGAAGGAARW
ncbi:bifunctional RNase H/acid phosphatase [Nocardioides sp.]|uniref:bifunctional RNase H/acid phosphatase n=1 Tax=Nocardioides sp. TaxID=35761 RepID=UPI0026356966|nr:bifunctional RNase H/acid phosphatase [Nocardioides sp.]